MPIYYVNTLVIQHENLEDDAHLFSNCHVISGCNMEYNVTTANLKIQTKNLHSVMTKYCLGMMKRH